MGPLAEESIDSYRLKVEEPLSNQIPRKVNRNQEIAKTPNLESSDLAHIISLNNDKPNTQTLVSNNSPEMSVYNAQQVAI